MVLLSASEDLSGAVEAVGGLSKMIADYGPLVVTLAVLFVLFIIITVAIVKAYMRSVKNMAETNTKILDQIIEQNDGLMDMVTRMNRPEYEANIVEIFTKFNDIFKEECKDIIRKTNAVRVGIYVFHNGAVASHGLPFFKMTCVSEWIKRNVGVKSRLTEHVNLPLSIFGEIVEKLYRSGNTIIIVSDDDYAIHTFISSETVKECLFCPVYDDSNKIMGFICCEYEEIIGCESVKTVVEQVTRRCDKIRPVLQFSDYQGKTYN